jgi:hypothetical protein
MMSSGDREVIVEVSARVDRTIASLRARRRMPWPQSTARAD